MPPLPGFSDNPFKTRSDFILAAISLLEPLESYKSPERARIKLATATGAGFSETAAQLEGFARPLWVVSELLKLQRLENEPILQRSKVRLQSWIKGIVAGTNPSSEEYWGDLGDCDQRMVEMESIAYSLLVAPDLFNFESDELTRKNLITWLDQINYRKMPENNWRWFRVFVNLALVRVLGVSDKQVQKMMDEDFAILDSFYLGEGWSSDGLWGEERKQADYYSGSFAIQFAQLLYIRFSGESDRERTEKYRKQAREFSIGFWRYFDEKGAAIPFGRSLTYRFAFAAFWAAVGIANVNLPAPLDSPGVVKGMLLRHLRWWTKQPHIFNADGSLSIGYAYPNMYMSEDYNSPQSVYWCLKSFIALGIPGDDRFWTCEEMPHPMDMLGAPKTPAPVASIWPPRHILCNTREHHFLLSSGQSTRRSHKSREAKYGKFAYSSAFAFSVPVGPLVEQLAADSTLCMSYEDGETWKVRWEPFDVQLENFRYGDGFVPCLASTWRPWKSVDLEVRTKLVSPLEKWPGWHIRIHTLRVGSSSSVINAVKRLRFIDSGFAISAQTSQGHSMFEKPCQAILPERQPSQGWWKDGEGSLIISEAGASGVLNLTGALTDARGQTGEKCRRNFQLASQGYIIKADANTNLIAQRTLIPAAYHAADFEAGGGTQSREISLQLITGVFAVESTKMDEKETWKAWQSRPTGVIDQAGQFVVV